MLSVIIPTLNEASNLGRLLRALLAEPQSLQIIVSDGGSRDRTREVAKEFPGVQFLTGPPGRGAQMNRGAREAHGDILVFLHADTMPAAGALLSLPDLLMTECADFGAFRLRFDPPVWLPSTLALLTAWTSPWCCFGDQGIFTSSNFFWRTGGFPHIPLLEDVHWIRDAGKRGRMVRSPYIVTTSSRRFQQVGAVRMSLRNVLILLRDLAGEDPARLAELYGQGAPPAYGAKSLAD